MFMFVQGFTKMFMFGLGFTKMLMFVLGFTKMSTNKTASQLVGLLNDLFGRFDR